MANDEADLGTEDVGDWVLAPATSSHFLTSVDTEQETHHQQPSNGWRPYRAKSPGGPEIVIRFNKDFTVAILKKKQHAWKYDGSPILDLCKKTVP